METFDLAGAWRLIQDERRIDISMKMPGDILSALVEEGTAPDPYEGMNEGELQWVGGTDWRIERKFEAPSSLLACESVFLDIDVIDTIASVWLNGVLVGDSADMFVRFRRDVTSALKKGKNLISILIRSPEAEAARIAEDLPYPIPASLYPVSSPHRNLIRKAQCMSGWDWGPCLMTGGVYDGIRLVGTEGPRVEYIRCSMVPIGGFDVVSGPLPASGPDFSVTVATEIWSPRAMEAILTVSLTGRELGRRVELPQGNSVVETSFAIEKPALWWPAGMGAQPLYDLEVSLGAAGNRSERDPSPHIARKRIGFRKLAVSTREDAIGREMKFVVNGRDCFAKGANWIPADALPSRWTKERMAGLLASAKEANMNCLRVWGGGRYESDCFYDLCDELGILIWQDCMFSCALYPSSPDFLGLVGEEMRHQVKRLADHPSLALWCGNNEALGAITWYEESKKSPARYIVDYDRLTEGVLGRIVREMDPGRCWWPSSPSAGPNDFSDNWHSDERGDMHYWTVWHEGKPFSEYLSVRPRFCSEFGFQAFPSPGTVASFAPVSERNITSPTMEWHQRHPRGNSLIVETMLRYFRMPRNFEETLYLSQVQQAMAIKTAVEYWRSERPRCMGTLYWQLNDLWPVTSWSSLEYDGSWKLLHYEARRFYDPLLLTLVVREGRIELRAVNDGFESLSGEWELAFFDFGGGPLALFEGKAELGAEGAALLKALPLSEVPDSPERCYAEARLRVKRSPSSGAAARSGAGADTAGGVNEDSGVERRALLFPTEHKRCSLVDPCIAARLDRDGPGGEEGALYLTLEARAAPAFWVAAELKGVRGRFEDAGFHLAKGESRRLGFISAENKAGEAGAESAGGAARAPLSDLASRLRVHDLKGSYE